MPVLTTEVADDTPTACRFKNADAEWILPHSDGDDHRQDAIRRAEALRDDAPHRDGEPVPAEMEPPSPPHDAVDPSEHSVDPSEESDTAHPRGTWQRTKVLLDEDFPFAAGSDEDDDSAHTASDEDELGYDDEVGDDEENSNAPSADDTDDFLFPQSDTEDNEPPSYPSHPAPRRRYAPTSLFAALIMLLACITPSEAELAINWLHTGQQQYNVHQASALRALLRQDLPADPAAHDLVYNAIQLTRGHKPPKPPPRRKNGLTVWSQNVSLVSETTRDLFFADLEKHDVDVCAVDDTKRDLTEGEEHKEYYVEGSKSDGAHNGIAFAIKHHLRRDCSIEALSTRLATLTLRLNGHGAGRRALCFIAGYAPIKPTPAAAKEFWDMTTAAIKLAKSNGHCVVLLGDLNAKIKMSDIRGESHSCGIPNTMDVKFPPTTDRNGRHLLKACTFGNLCIVNFMHHMKRKKYNTFIPPPGSAARASIPGGVLFVAAFSVAHLFVAHFCVAAKPFFLPRRAFFGFKKA